MGIVAVDIRNTLADVNSELERFFGERRREGEYRGLSFAPDQEWFKNNLWIFDRAKALKGSVKMLHNISLRDEVVYVTARPEEAHQVTKRWLERNGYPEGEILHSTKKVGKGAIASAIGAAWAIDDVPEEVRDYARHGIPCFVVAQDYNRECRNRFRWGERRLDMELLRLLSR